MRTQDKNDSLLRVHPAYATLFREAGIDDFAALAALPPDEVHRDVPGRRTFRVILRTPQGTTPAYIKHSRERSGWRGVWRRFNPLARDEAANEWTRLNQLAEQGIAAPAPMAYACRRRGGRVVESIIVMSNLTGATQGDWFFERLWQEAPPDERVQLKRQLIRQMADLARRLHAAGFHHQDFYLCHFWFRSREQGVCDLWLLDHHRTGWHRRRRRWLVKDLAQLHYSLPRAIFSGSDWVRFLHGYFGVRRLRKWHKRFHAAVLRKSRRIARHTPRHVFTRQPS